MKPVRRHQQPAQSRRAQHGRMSAKPSALLLALLRRSRWLWLGWFEARWQAHQNWRVARRTPRADRPMLESLEPKLLLSADLMPADHAVMPVIERQVDLPTPRSAADTVASAHPLALRATILATPAATAAPSVTITGPGTGQLVAQGTGFLLQLSGTTSASGVSIVNPAGGQLALTGITTSSAVGALSLANADLSGAASFAGSVASLTVGRVSGAALNIPGTADFSLKAGAVTDSLLIARGSNVSVNVASWTSSAAGASRIEAAGLKSLVVAGEFSANVLLSGVASGFTLTSVQISGAISGGLWSVHGRAGALSAGSTAAALRMNISGTVVAFTTTGDASGELAMSALQLLQVGGSMRGMRLLIGADLGDDAALGGSAANADSFKPGTLARVRVTGDVVDSKIYISIDPVNGVYGDGNDVQLGTPVQRLQELVVGGKLLGSTNIVAPLFPTSVRVGGQTLDPATLAALSTTPPDRIAPVIASFALAPASDTGVAGDNHTTATPVSLIGTTEASARLSLSRTGSAAVLATAVAAADGSFSFTGIALNLGDNAFTLNAADAAGNSSQVSLTVSRDAIPDTTPPALSAALVNDTGANASDGLTSDARFAGTTSDNLAVTQLLAALDPNATTALTDLSTLLQAGGAFALSRSQLDSLAGGTLAQGAHSLRLVAKDAAGNATTLNLAFTLDSQAPTLTGFGLAAASDTGTLGDNRTSASVVTLVGQTETGAALTLRAKGSSAVLGSAVAAADGGFSLGGIALALGSNDFDLSWTDAAGNTGTAALAVVREAVVSTDTTPPTVTAKLQNDTGSSASDAVTNDPTPFHSSFFIKIGWTIWSEYLWIMVRNFVPFSRSSCPSRRCRVIAVPRVARSTISMANSPPPSDSQLTP